MRPNDSVWTRSLWNAVLAVAAVGLTASNVAAATDVHLIAAPMTKAVTLPNGNDRVGADVGLCPGHRAPRRQRHRTPTEPDGTRP